MGDRQGRWMSIRRDQSGQTVVIAAVGAGVLALILLLVVNLGGVFLTLTGVQNTLRDAARAGTLVADGQGGDVYLEQDAAAANAQVVFDAGVAQVSGWLAGAPSLDVEILNPPDGGCTAFAGGATCYRRPAVRLRTRITINTLLGEWGAVSFELETVAAAGMGDPLTVSTPAPPDTLEPVSTEIVGAGGTVWPTLAVTVEPTAAATVNPTATKTPAPTMSPPPTVTMTMMPTLESPLLLPASP